MREWIENQWQNKFLYTPFLMAGGAALYFTLCTEPDIITTIILTIITLAISTVPKAPRFFRALFIFIFGFTYALLYTNIINTPILKHDIKNLNISGKVTALDYTPDKNKIFISVNAQDMGLENKNTIIRLSATKDITLPNIGDTVTASGKLFKPDSIIAPHSFDFARWLYFNKISATGYVTDIQILTPAQSSGIENLRNTIHIKTESFLTDTLVLGYKGAIPKQHSDIWTMTGIGHVWSISGFHMTLVGGWLFLLFYIIFRAIPYTTRRLPAKIPAMCCAWCGLMFYLLLSGSDVATMRAFIMTSLAFSAFIIGRKALSVRNVALAFCIIFLINPHYVMQAGFQLSFAAVFGLAWLLNDIHPKMPDNKLLKIIYATILTTLTATVFTAPFIAIHFGQIPVYGLIGNLIFLPVFSFIIMPLILIGSITALFDYHLATQIAHNVYDWIYKLAVQISDLPHTTITTPHIPNSAVILFICGFICLIFIKNIKIKTNYILFGVFILSGIINTYTYEKPVFYASYDHELVAFKNDKGMLEFNKSRASNHYFAFGTWKQINGEKADSKNIRRKHNKGIYEYNTENFNLVYIQKFVPLMHNIEQLCKSDDVKYIISYFDIYSEHCNSKILQGALTISPKGTVNYLPHKRRWTYNPHE